MRTFTYQFIPAAESTSGSPLENKVYQFQLLPFGLNTAPQVFTRLGHTVTGYLHRQGISVIPYLDDWLIHHPDRTVLFRHQAQLMNTLDLVGFVLNKKKSELDLTQDLQFLRIRLRLDLGEASLPESKAWEIVACARHLSSLHVLSYTQVSQLMGSLNWASGLIPLGRLYLRTLFSFIRPDRPVYATASIRPSGPCQPSAALAGPTFSYLRNSSPHISGGVHDFYGRFDPGVGRSHGGFTDFGYLDPYRPQTPHQLFGAQSGNTRPTALGSSAPGPPGYDCYGQFDSSFVYQQARRDQFPYLVVVDSRASPLVRGSEHKSPSKAHRRLPERDSRPPISSEPANTDRVVPTPRDRETHLQGLGDTRSRHVRNSVELPPSSVHVSNSGAKSPSGGCSVSRLAGEVNVHVSPFPPAQQSHSETSIHSGGGGSSHSPLVAESIVVSTPTTSLWGTPPSSSLPSGSSVPTGSEVCLRRKVVPSACMEALMRHYKAAGFSDKVSWLAAAPRRPSTNRMYNDRWLCFARWAAGQGFDPLDPTAAQIASFLFTLFDTHGLSPQTVKGYKTCLGSVLNRTGKAKVVLHKTISDTIASMVTET